MANESQFSVEGIHYASGRPVRIDISDGLIVSVDEIPGRQAGTDGMFIAPGLIDNQVNGYASVDFSGDDLTVEGVTGAAKAIWKTGVTTFFPTLITNSRENLIRNFGILNRAIVSDSRLSGSVPGFHLEGPYISPEEGYRGCHPAEYTRNPSWDEFQELMDASGGRIIEVTLAPELEGAFGFIRKCTDAGIIIALGHTNSDAAVIARAVDCGARLSTHLGNGCANFIHRHNNPIWPQLAEDRLTSTVIADGFHLLPEELRVFLKVKGTSGLILTSDVMYLAGMAPGRYTFLGSEVLLTPEGMLRNVALNCLAGASFPLKTGVGNMMRFTDCSLEDAITMASGNVARISGLDDRGRLEAGRRADIILFEIKDNQLMIRKTYLNGELVFSLEDMQ